jgi:hypothetical protein
VTGLPTHRDINFDPNTPQFVVRTYCIPWGWYTYGPFATFNDAANWAADRNWAPHDVKVQQATKGSPWKSMKDPGTVRRRVTP